MIEVEIKARVRDAEQLKQRLRARAAERASVYQDTYYDRPDGTFLAAGKELRLRIVDDGRERCCLLTYKGSVVEPETGSKPETELTVSDDRVADELLLALGFGRVLSFEKHCTNFAFHSDGRDMLVSVVTVPELDGTFVEVETLATEDDVASALTLVRRVVADLGIAEADLTTELYTDAVTRRRETGCA